MPADNHASDKPDYDDVIGRCGWGLITEWRAGDTQAECETVRHAGMGIRARWLWVMQVDGETPAISPQCDACVARKAYDLGVSDLMAARLVPA